MVVRRSRIPLETFQVAANLGVRPVGRSDEFPADHTVAVNGIGFGPHVRVEKVGCALARIADSNQVDMAIADEAGIRIGIVVDAYREDHDVGILMMELLQRRKLFDAGTALAPPKVQKHNLAAVVAKVHGSLSVRNGEIRSRFPRLFWVRAAIAAKNRGQRQKQNED
jgi:hypothetical protein